MTENEDLNNWPYQTAASYKKNEERFKKKMATKKKRKSKKTKSGNSSELKSLANKIAAIKKIVK